MNRLGVFAKFWEPGIVKTRLAATIGAGAASELYRLFVETTLHRFDAVGERRELFYSPADRITEFTQISGTSWHAVAQRGGDLGERMHDYFARSSSDPAIRSVLIGSDSPCLPIRFVQEAFELLKKKRVVLGPSEDGGYYLIGIRGEVPDIFNGIAWSTDEVYQQTVSLLTAHQIPFAELSNWYDVDDITDLQRLAVELSTVDIGDPMLGALCTAVSDSVANWTAARAAPDHK